MTTLTHLQPGLRKAGITQHRSTGWISRRCWLPLMLAVWMAHDLPAGAADRIVKQAGGASGTAKGPLRVHPTNPRYFTDDGLRAVYLTGSHTWDNLQDMGVLSPGKSASGGAPRAFKAPFTGHAVLYLRKPTGLPKP